MQQTSEKYKRIARGTYNSRGKVIIDGTEYTEVQIYSISTKRNVFGKDNPCVGSCYAGEISISFKEPPVNISRMAVILPYVQIYNSTEASEWIQKGKFFIDTRSTDEDTDKLSISGYDAMLKAEAPYPASTMAWPAKDAAVLREIAQAMGVTIDARTWDMIPSAGRYNIPLPAQYTMREVLGYIAGMYGGNFIINDYGDLQLIALNGLPEETNLLISESGSYITFGGLRIKLRRS